MTEAGMITKFGLGAAGGAWAVSEIWDRFIVDHTPLKDGSLLETIVEFSGSTTLGLLIGIFVLALTTHEN